ncbi:hypothetical protein Tco_1446706 [Tanacetum coccineum]
MHKRWEQPERTAKLRNDILMFHQEGPQNFAGSITTWEDLTTHFLAQFFPPGRTAKLRNDILIRTIDQSADGKLRDRNTEESWALLKDLSLYDNKSWNDPRDFTKSVKVIALPQDVPSTSDRRLIELENQVTQVNNISTSCEICSGPHDTQYCIEDPEQAFVEYASSRTDEARDKWYTFKPEQNNLGDTYNPSWRSHPNLSFMASQDARLSMFEAYFKQQQSEMTNKIDTVLKAITDRIAEALPNDTVKNPKLRTYPVFSARSYPIEDPQCSTIVYGLINAITICPKQPNKTQNDKPKEEEEKDNLENIHVNPLTLPDPSVSLITEKVLKLNSFFKSLGLVPQSFDTKVVCTKGDDDEVMFIEIIRKNDDSHEEGPEEEGSTTTEGVGVEHFDMFPTRSELAYQKYLMCGPIPFIFLRNPIITEGCPLFLKIPCNIGHVHFEKAYIDLNSPLNVMTQMMYNWIMRRKLDPR